MEFAQEVFYALKLGIEEDPVRFFSGFAIGTIIGLFIWNRINPFDNE